MAIGLGPVEENVAVVVKAVSCGNHAVDMERPVEIGIEVDDFDRVDLQGAADRRRVWKFRRRVRKLHRTPCSCNTGLIKISECGRSNQSN